MKFYDRFNRRLKVNDIVVYTYDNLFRFAVVTDIEDELIFKNLIADTIDNLLARKIKDLSKSVRYSGDKTITKIDTVMILRRNESQ